MELLLIFDLYLTSVYAISSLSKGNCVSEEGKGTFIIRPSKNLFLFVCYSIYKNQGDCYNV